MAARFGPPHIARRWIWPCPGHSTARYGDGIDRGLCLGGGGLFFVAWQAAYLRTLATHGIRFDTAERVVGTSAGSMVASALAAGRLNRLHSEISVVSKLPSIISTLAPASQLHPSQQRALDLFLKATDGDPDTVQEIGHAALAALTPSAGTTRRNILLVLGTVRWSSDALRITCVDAYTGERCVVTRQSDTAIPRAVAASSAVPGIFCTPADRRPPVHGRRREWHRHPPRPPGRGQSGCSSWP